MYWLRPILLLAGALFIAALFWWDRRRTRQAASSPPARATRAEPSFEPMPVPLPAASNSPAPIAEREPRRALPVIDWPSQAPAAAPETKADVTMPEVPAQSAHVIAPAPLPLPETPPPMIVDWPAENARRIVTLRVVPAGTDRLPGRALRQALTGCGFRHGEFGIFHLPDDDGRVILSAASLVLPGTLDPAGMDFQRYPGLNVFAVLPGPVSAGRALERLGQLALELAARVSGRVHDDQSTTLTANTVSAWRKRMLASLGDADAGAATGAASSANHDSGADDTPAPPTGDGTATAEPSAAGPAD